MDHRVGNRFAHGHLNSERGRIRRAAIADKPGHGGSSISNRLNVAGQNESSRLFGHRHARPFSPGELRYRLLLNLANEDVRVTRALVVCQEMDTGAQASLPAVRRHPWRLTSPPHQGLRFTRDHSTCKTNSRI